MRTEPFAFLEDQLLPLRIAFRLLVPGFVTVLLFTFVQTWNNYFLPS